jgi:hypothetical protein
MLARLLSVLLVVVLLSPGGCDTGLAPLNEPSGFSGVITFKNWPPPDSVQELRVIAFLEIPSDSASILQVLLSGGAAVYPNVGAKGLDQYVDSLHYTFTTEGSLLQVATYKYVAIAHKYGPDIFKDWRPAAVYSTDPVSQTPTPVRVLLHKITPGINFDVDFHNPPPKPWR